MSVLARRCHFVYQRTNRTLPLNRRMLRNIDFDIRPCTSSSGSYNNFYDILGVEQTASEKEIRDAYIAKVKQSHPDSVQHRGFTRSDCPNFLDIQEAYVTLSDGSLRRHYDTALAELADGPTHVSKAKGATEYTELTERETKIIVKMRACETMVLWQLSSRGGRPIQILSQAFGAVTSFYLHSLRLPVVRILLRRYWQRRVFRERYIFVYVWETFVFKCCVLLLFLICSRVFQILYARRHINYSEDDC